MAVLLSSRMSHAHHQIMTALLLPISLISQNTIHGLANLPFHQFISIKRSYIKKK